MKITDEAVKAFTQYRRKQIAELRPWKPGADMTSVSVSPEDTKAGSPKPGDMIARNPKNHADQWLVAAAYFADNFEPLTALPHLSQGAVRVSDEFVDRIAESVHLQEDDGDWFKLPGRYRTQQRKRVRQVLTAIDIVQRRILSTLSPAPVGVTDEVSKNSWRSNEDIAIELMDAALDADAAGRVADARFMRIAASRLEALASHEPSPDDANDELERVDADANAMAWGAELKSAEARILELEADLEVANDKLARKDAEWEEGTARYFNVDFPDSGGQSNE